MTPKLLLAATLPLLAACGASDPGMTSGQVATFRATAASISGAAASYGTQAAGWGDLPACTAGEAGYQGQVGPMVDRMASMAGSMDDHMASMGHLADGDMACGSAAMAAELARHRGAACASTTDMAPNQAEAAQHAAAMAAWAVHMMDRADQMGSLMGAGMMSGTGGTLAEHCVKLADGSYALQP